jgi:site-specific recombinase XerC
MPIHLKIWMSVCVQQLKLETPSESVCKKISKRQDYYQHSVLKFERPKPPARTDFQPQLPQRLSQIVDAGRVDSAVKQPTTSAAELRDAA